MATTNQLADTLNQLRIEMANRLDDFEKDGELTSTGSSCLSGILEGLSSLEDAIRKCNGIPSVGPTIFDYPYPWAKTTEFIGDSPNCRVIKDSNGKIITSDYAGNLDLIWNMYNFITGEKT